MSALAELAEERARVERELQASRLKLSRLEATAKKQRQRRPLQTPQWRGSHREVQYILCAVELTNWLFHDTLAVLDHVRSPPNWGGLATESRITVIEDLALRHDSIAVMKWMDETVPQNCSRLADLWTVHSEWRTAKWVQSVNQERGTAPSSLKVCEMYRTYLKNAPAELGLLTLPCDSMNAQRCWAVKWRRRWGGRMGVLPLGDVEPVEVLREKAGSAKK